MPAVLKSGSTVDKVMRFLASVKYFSLLTLYTDQWNTVVLQICVKTHFVFILTVDA